MSAALSIIGIAFAATVSHEAFARAPAATTRLHHHTHHYSGQIRHRQVLVVPPPTVERELVGSPYCWPYDYAFNPYDYCGASYIVSW
jgi:hypothetical protein